MTAKKKKPIIALAVVSAAYGVDSLDNLGQHGAAAQQIYGFERAAAPSV